MKKQREDDGWLECTEIASPLSMVERTRQLQEIAKRYNAEYDGWGSCCPSAKKSL